MTCQSESWRESALCAQVDTELFFPDGRGGNFAAAKRVCRSCSVRTQCLEDALATAPTDDWGIWGATSPRQRREIRKSRAQAAADEAA